MRLRVVTFNVHGFRAGVEPVAEALRTLSPDLVLLQECGSKRTVRGLARSLDMEVASTHRRFNRVRNAVLFGPSWHVARTDVADLSREARTMRRGFVAVSLRSSQGRVVAVSAHLGLSPAERRRHARELADHVIGEGHPAVLGVDLNEGPTGDASRWMAGRLFDAFAKAGRGDGATFPASAPSARIDYLFVTEELAVREAWVPPLGDLSDHRPVVTDVEIDRA